MQNEPDEGHEEAGHSYVSKGAVPKTSAKVFRSRPSKPENAEPSELSDGLKSVVRQQRNCEDSFPP